MEPFGSKGDLSYGGSIDMPVAKQAIGQFLRAFGLDTDSEDLRETPRRVAELYAELFAGLYHSPPKMTVFKNDTDHSETVLLKDIFYTSTCSHHLMPFVGVAHVAYVPGRLLTGLSKLARIVDYFAMRPQLQERMATDIANFLQKATKPKGVAVYLAGSHGCVATRGAAKSGSQMITTVLRGVFAGKNSRYRMDFLSAIGGRP